MLAKLFFILQLFTPSRAESSVPRRMRVPNQEKWLNDKIFLMIFSGGNSAQNGRVSARSRLRKEQADRCRRKII
ncbi:hypothetical protein KHQ08_00315 (plasmid) [Pseudochrobactrum algeriensis]|uniref:hypothetical protein n=1 Tax=Pseudochrobactrum algeriensis TaxID=2834768 RepID=UPI001BCCCB0D|nr:hypothetical protein [Pseudochrobactrum algeriensis]MBX8812680.1 hypothetical protein [Ochrobactrum sp. MR34]QVQ35380.1 hypothetical protein KHQ08_00315 [Pseudochrobactrum algeriensis]QVQ41995.1 hypothetical protein KHQ07_16185 [Pseudochrobactrum algeriensis]QVQ42610.1 hypothetical protein KHQ09_00980 [Pseudochrobactrum algeriensis]